MYQKILTDMLPEMRNISDENIVIETDNIRVIGRLTHRNFIKKTK